jgi:hypothetical protein
MIAIAGVLLLIVVIFSVAVVISNPAILDLSIFGAHLPATAGGVYFTGAGAMLVLVLALDLLRRGVRREVRRRRKVKSLQAVASGTTRAPRSVQDPLSSEPKPEPEAISSSAEGSQRSESRGSESQSSESQSSESQSGDSQGGDSRTSQGSATGATALASASLLERQALLDEAEELTGDDPRR